MKIALRFLLVFQLFVSTCFAQVEEPPNLSLGAQGLLFEKGAIDVALLSDLIVSKQEELKQEFIKRNVIKALNQNNFTSYAFTYSSLNDLMSIKEKKSLSKKLLIYIQDFALVYGFTEFYLQASGKLGNENLMQLITAIKENNTGYDPSPAIYFDKKDETTKRPTFYLKSFTKYPVKMPNKETVTLTDFLVDFFYAVLKKNDNVSERGFLHLENYGDMSYLYSTYNKFLTSNYVNTPPADTLDERLTAEIDILFNYYTLIKDLKDSDYSFMEMFRDVAFSEVNDTKGFSERFLKQPFTTLNDNRNTFYADLKKIDTKSQNYTEETQKKLRDYVEKAPKLVAAADELYKRYQLIAEDPTKTRLPFQASDLYYINDVAKPALAYLTQFGDLDEEYLENLEMVEKGIKDAIAYNAYQDMKDLYIKLTGKSEADWRSLKKGEREGFLANASLENFKPFIELIANLDKFNRAETYAKGLQVLSSAGDLFKDFKAGDYLKTLVELLQTYTNVDTKTNDININVEEIIIKLYDKFIAGHSKKTVSFFFTIGINSTLNTQGSERLVDKEGNPVDNLIFAGEKIGVKINLFNVERHRERKFAGTINEIKKKESEGEVLNGTIQPNMKNQVKPIFTDFYLSGYTSGLLYNLVNTTNADEKLGGYMIGTSLGTSFFNNMDLNLFVNFYATKTQDFQFKNNLIGIAWDIPIIEYLSALTKKRNSK